jgi:hypothetical protein
LCAEKFLLPALEFAASAVNLQLAVRHAVVLQPQTGARDFVRHFIEDAARSVAIDDEFRAERLDGFQ